METFIKFRPSWYVFEDGSIGIYLLEGNRFGIGSGSSLEEITAVDYDMAVMVGAVRIGSVDEFPTIDQAIIHVEKMSRNILKLLENINHGK